ncbi:hypothetical protein MKEN_00612900 [Mycena kentingensis (nom. inval.)]|nr:hypothetical protein MKEN_00612900 [Mycena kentingensis (nom. inval.)]
MLALRLHDLFRKTLLGSPPRRPRKSKTRSKARERCKPGPLLASAIRRFFWSERTKRVQVQAHASSADGDDDDFVLPPPPRAPRSARMPPPARTTWNIRPVTAPQINTDAFFAESLTKIRLSGAHRRTLAPEAFLHTDVDRNLQYQRIADCLALGAIPSQVPGAVSRAHLLVPATASHIMRLWWRLQQIINGEKEAREHLQRVYGETTYGEWQEHRHRWLVAASNTAPPSMRFWDVPWPVYSGVAMEPKDVTDDEIHRLLIRPDATYPLEWAAVHRLELEMVRWGPEQVHKIIRQVVPEDRAAVSKTANKVLNACYELRLYLLWYFAHERRSSRAQYKYSKSLDRLKRIGLYKYYFPDD